MKFCITPLLILFICFKSEAQRPYPENQKFEFDSLMVLSHDSLNMDLGQYLNNPFKAKQYRTNFILPSNAKWQLMYYRYVGWYSIVGGPGESFNYLYKAKSDFIIRSSECLNSKFEFIVNPDRGIAWHAHLIDKNILVLSWGHSYPNGNMTSWDYNKYYFFKRVY